MNDMVPIHRTRRHPAASKLASEIAKKLVAELPQASLNEVFSHMTAIQSLRDEIRMNEDAIREIASKVIRKG